MRATDKRGQMLHKAPFLTIEAEANRPARVKWISGLKDASGTCPPHLPPVDPTLRRADPPGGMAGRDARPGATGQPTPDPYDGPVPMVTHVHGPVGVARLNVYAGPAGLSIIRGRSG